MSFVANAWISNMILHANFKQHFDQLQQTFALQLKLQNTGDCPADR
jgi:hypothetical protein